MQFAAVQFDITWEDKAANHARIERMLDEAAIAPGTFVLLPELGDTGFSFNLKTIVDDRSMQWAKQCAKQRNIWLQHGFAEIGPDGKGRNCAAVITPQGDVAGVYRKVHPFTFSREAEHYGGGNELIIRECETATVCPQICYDLRFPELWRLGAMSGAEVYTIGASWPAARQAHWRALLIARAIENQAYVVAVNRCGEDPFIKYAGGSIIISPQGEVLTECDDQPGVLHAELDMPGLHGWREKFPALRDIHRDLLGSIDQPKQQSPAG